MKRFTAILLCAILLMSLCAFTSCDQATVDSMRQGFLETGKELMSPFFKVAESHKDKVNGDGEDEDEGIGGENKDESAEEIGGAIDPEDNRPDNSEL